MLREWESVIGLEVHLQLKTGTKSGVVVVLTMIMLTLIHTCPICLGHPGPLPKLNKKLWNML